MPYKRKGKTVYKEGKKLGSSKSVEKAKAYERVLRAIEHGWRPSGKGR